MFRFIKSQYIRIRYGRTNQIARHAQIGRRVEMLNTTLQEYAIIAREASLKHCTVGGYSSIGRNTKIINTDIGKFCAISWDVTINAISHPSDHVSICAFPYVPSVGRFVASRKQKLVKVVIKNDVWIGAHSIIMPGVTIGNGAIVGAGAVVTKNVPDYAIVAGVPAKVIKYRFKNEVIEELLKLRWWDWRRRVIARHIPLFQHPLSDEIIQKLVEASKEDSNWKD